ncbi:hypothetical protein C7I55_26000 [Sphingomonas deserti]|uniref:Uncharacterized protein n=1 Tax=Allosphingosinicella deserti TaxID=2116704 RepID=A0A2P7QEX5_9SPHN|nr:hypothetical protein C7I55_26000 [Sphingomonas deserti]
MTARGQDRVVAGPAPTRGDEIWPGGSPSRASVPRQLLLSASEFVPMRAGLSSSNRVGCDSGLSWTRAAAGAGWSERDRFRAFGAGAATGLIAGQAILLMRRCGAGSAATHAQLTALQAEGAL